MNRVKKGKSGTIVGEVLIHLKKYVERQKGESWNKFCGDLENTLDASSLQKVLSKDPGYPVNTVLLKEVMNLSRL